MTDQLFPHPEMHEMDWIPPDTLHCNYCDKEYKFLPDGSLMLLHEGDGGDGVEHSYIPEAVNEARLV